MTLPNFLIIGAQKSGTTWLARQLRQHPEVFLAERELHFFDKASNYARGIEWYESFFVSARGRPAVGEKTPDYLWANGIGGEGHLPDVHRNVHEHLPAARLVVVLRDPVRRAVSAAQHLITTGRVDPRHDVGALLVGGARELALPHGVIDYGFYRRQLDAWLELYPREQMLVLVFEEDIEKHPEQGLERVCEFLGVGPGFRFRRAARSANPHRASRLGLGLSWSLPRARRLWRQLDRVLPTAALRPGPEVLAELQRLYQPENERLFELLGRRLDDWGLPNG